MGKEKFMTVRAYAKSRERSWDTCKKVAKRNGLGELHTYENGSMERRLSESDIEEMDRRWRG